MHPLTTVAAVLVLGFVGIVSAEQQACWKSTTTRGVGTIPKQCSTGEELSGALCYPVCKAGYTGHGPVCWQQCPPEYHDAGLLCTQSSASTILKDTYTRGVGHMPSCTNSSGGDLSGALCYESCPEKHTGEGPVCWKQCPADFPVQCGAICGEPGFKCTLQVAKYLKNALATIAACSAGPTIPCVITVAGFAKDLTLSGICESADKLPKFLQQPSRTCWKTTTTRGAGTIPKQCPAGWELDGALCYPKCASGYHGTGPVCSSKCPADSFNSGVMCVKSESLVVADASACPWYDKCGVATKCTTCPDGYRNKGCLCAAQNIVTPKMFYGRGVGVPPTCSDPNDELNGALCYPKCNAHYTGAGPVCWNACPANMTDCGAMCGGSEFQCTVNILTWVGTAASTVSSCATGDELHCISGVASEAVGFALDGLC